MDVKITPQDFFEKMYNNNPDPWAFSSSQYELYRYESILKALSMHRYRQTFEPGCSIGILSEKLAAISDNVQAFDISRRATEIAKKRCIHLSNVNIQCGSLENVAPNKNTDLVILSEIGYYFEPAILKKIIQSIFNSCPDITTFLAVHWLGESKDHVLSGDLVHQIIGETIVFELQYQERHQDFRLDLWRKI